MGTYSDQSRLEQQQVAELPRLPVPPLNQTMQIFLRSAKPFLTEKEFQITKSLSDEFAAIGGVGEKLQKLLENRAANTDNWLEDWWLHAAYLDYRLPLPVNSSTAMAFPLRQLNSISDQLQRTVDIIAGALDFKTKLYSNKFPLERMGPYTLDPWQYYNVFGTCRIPGETIDSLRQFSPAQLSNHIVVAHNKHFFAVPMYGEEGEVLNQSQILAQLNQLISQSPHPSSTPVGILTTENRNIWSKAYKVLKDAAEQNRETLDMIERSIFLICLDGPQSAAEINASNRVSGLGMQTMHGGGSNSANRWFDKCIQLIISQDGESGISFEHSPADGQPVSIMMDYIENYCKHYSGSADPVPPAAKYAQPQHLQFIVPTEVQDIIHTAQQNLDSLVDDFEIYSTTFTGYGKEFIKAQNLSPDSFIQMALQLTFYRIHNVPGAHYKTALTRKFLHGRTETIRSCSLESVHFAHTMLNPAASNTDKLEALRSAIKAHKEYAIQAMEGQGVDRHLLGLRLIAKENGMEVPKLFLDAGYTKSGHMRLSTSQVNMRVKSFSYFGPVVPDGYGCCYNPHPDEILYSTSAFYSSPDTSAVKFSKTLEVSFNEMKEICTSAHSTHQDQKAT